MNYLLAAPQKQLSHRDSTLERKFRIKLYASVPIGGVRPHFKGVEGGGNPWIPDYRGFVGYWFHEMKIRLQEGGQAYQEGEWR